MSSIDTFALATQTINTNTDLGIKDAVNDPNAILAGILSTTYIWAGIICVAIIIVAGFIYVTSSGEASKIKRAREAITGAIVGLILIMLAFVITKFVLGRF